MKILKTLSHLVGLGILASCAGPMDPFGPTPLVSRDQRPSLTLTLDHWQQTPQGRFPASKAQIFDLDQGKHEDVSIEIYPRAQRYHLAQEFKITVSDQRGIPSTHGLKIFHNDQDVTSTFLSQAQTHHDRARNHLTISFPNLRLPSRSPHDIVVTYSPKGDYVPSPLTELYVKRFNPPRCTLVARESGIQQAGPFGRHWGVLRKIEAFSEGQGINPNLMAALVAQESSFNPRAVSTAKAIGLTQVTDIAAQHVLEEEDKRDWPIFPQISEWSYPRVRASILTGKIHPGNEWRLHVEKSLQGGLSYLQYLEDYWNLPNHRNQLVQTFGTANRNSEIFTEVILASYNSGPFRVRRAIASRGEKWLDAPELNEASRYIRNIQSYCDHFASVEGL